MSYMPRVAAATTAEWADVVDELDRWAKCGRVVRLWWRDDDAVAATPRLDRLLRLTADVPVSLAVIPALARADLAGALAGAPRAEVLQHGWRHVDRAQQGKKSEYPHGRSATAVAAELGAGWARLNVLFGARALPVLVPPWNRFDADYVWLLRECGIAGLSTMASSRRGPLPSGLTALDVHLDPVAWRGDRGFIGEPEALSALLGLLQARRLGAGDAAEPIGILTHHLIMDEPTEAFLDRLIGLTRAHKAVHWAAASEWLQ